MATIQKTTLKRYNGTDWDPVYLANSADITYVGKGFTVAEGAGFTVGQTVAATENVAAVLEAVINNLTAIDKNKIPALQAGSGITSIAADKLTGVISYANLPEDVAGSGIEVANEEAKAALSAADVSTGDIVKVQGGKVYLVTAASEADGVTYMELSDSASEIAWARMTGTPTTLEGYGITDAVNVAEKVQAGGVANAGKILVLNAEGKLAADITGDAATLGGHAADYFATAEKANGMAAQIATAEGEIDTLQAEIKAIDAAWITTGTIDIARLPASAIETMYVAANEAAIAALTSAQVQNGDTIKNAETGLMYFVTDETKLGTADYKLGLVEYTAGAASSVEWSGILNKPTTLAGYGITDAVASNMLVSTAAGNAGKVLVLNADGKMDVSITGDADTIDGMHAADLAKQSDMTAAQAAISEAQTNITNLQAAVGTGANGLATKVETLQSEMSTAQTDIANLKAGTAITALAASKLTGTVSRANLPADISGRLFKKADLNEAMSSLTTETAATGDLVKTADGKVYVIVDGSNLAAAEGYELLVDVAGSTIAWSQISGVPTTLAAMNWSDAVTTAMLVDAASVGNAGKVLKIGADGKLAASITGDAATVGGHAAEYFATKEEHDALAGRMATAEGEIDTLQSEMKNIDAAWITTGIISIDRLPHGALERCVVVADDAARFALTTAQIQTGDTVKVTGTGLMYFVKDDSKLNSEDGYEVYTAGTAAAVDWSGVIGKPTTLAGYGITDAVAASEKVSVASSANAGKILVLNADGKLDVDITGSVEWAKILNGPASTPAAIDAAVEASTHTNRAVLDALGVDADGRLTYNGDGVAYKAELDQVALGALIVTSDVSTLDAAQGQLALEAIV